MTKGSRPDRSGRETVAVPRGGSTIARRPTTTERAELGLDDGQWVVELFDAGGRRRGVYAGDRVRFESR